VCARARVRGRAREFINFYNILMPAHPGGVPANFCIRVLPRHTYARVRVCACANTSRIHREYAYRTGRVADRFQICRDCSSKWSAAATLGGVANPAKKWMRTERARRMRGVSVVARQHVLTYSAECSASGQQRARDVSVPESFELKNLLAWTRAIDTAYSFPDFIGLA